MPPVMKRVYCGIDPGRSGGIAYHDGRVVGAQPMGDTERDLWEQVQALPVGTVAYIEKVGGFMGEGSEAPGAAMFNFGWNYGGIRMALIAAEIPFEEVTPGVWQKALGISPRKKRGHKYTEKKSAFKNRLKAKAQQIFPTIKVTLAIADALLIAEYCRRKHKGLL